MSEAGMRKWIFAAGAGCSFLAGLLGITGHNFVLAGAFICLGSYQALAATGSLQEQGSNKYRLTALLAGLGGVLSIVAAVQLALK